MADIEIKKAEELVKNAEKLLSDNNPMEASRTYDTAASLYKQLGNHQEAASCYASAASCYGIDTGEKMWFNAASRYQYAGEEAVKYQDYTYARYLYHEAARLYEKDGHSKWFSLCFYMSKVCEGDHAWKILSSSETIRKTLGRGQGSNMKSYINYLSIWIFNVFFRLLWGYGEKPYRAFLSALIIILFSCIIFYVSGTIGHEGKTVSPSFFDALYLSVMTFTTVGYGDYYPIGIYRLFSMFEALSSVFIMPLFVISLTRKYLRTYY